MERINTDKSKFTIVEDVSDFHKGTKEIKHFTYLYVGAMYWPFIQWIIPNWQFKANMAVFTFSTHIPVCLFVVHLCSLRRHTLARARVAHVHDLQICYVLQVHPLQSFQLRVVALGGEPRLTLCVPPDQFMLWGRWRAELNSRGLPITALRMLVKVLRGKKWDTEVLTDHRKPRMKVQYQVWFSISFLMAGNTYSGS